MAYWGDIRYEASPASNFSSGGADISLNSSTVAVGNNGLSAKENGANSKIKIKGWNPKEPYIYEYKNTPKSQLMNKYYKLKEQYSEQPSLSTLILLIISLHRA